MAQRARISGYERFHPVTTIDYLDDELPTIRSINTTVLLSSSTPTGRMLQHRLGFSEISGFTVETGVVGKD